MPPRIVSEEIPYDPETHHCDSLELTRPMGGHLWWNSLYWTNFPQLSILDQQAWSENPDAEVPASLMILNSDNRLAEQYITFGSAREDLCCSRALPARGFKLTVECMQYEGVRDGVWDFPLSSYVPKRDNHQDHSVQARRFWDNGVLHLGLNAEEFSEVVQPVADLEAYIHMADKPPVENVTWGYHCAVLRIEGWPYRIKRLGSFEGYGDGCHQEFNCGIGFWEETPLWELLEGKKCITPGPGGMEMQGNSKKGFKFWASLFDFDWLGRKVDESKHYDPEIPPEKGYIWFSIVDTVANPATGKKAVKIQLLDEGIVPAWMDLNFLKVFAGGLPLGNLSELESEGPPGSTHVYRTSGNSADVEGVRKVVVKNAHSQIVFDEPKTMQVNDFVDMGWAIHDCCYTGATVKLSPKPSRWVENIGRDEGAIEYRASGPPPLCHGEGKDKLIIAAPKSDYVHERRLVV